MLERHRSILERHLSLLVDPLRLQRHPDTRMTLKHLSTNTPIWWTILNRRWKPVLLPDILPLLLPRTLAVVVFLICPLTWSNMRPSFGSPKVVIASAAKDSNMAASVQLVTGVSVHRAPQEVLLRPPYRQPRKVDRRRLNSNILRTILGLPANSSSSRRFASSSGHRGAADLVIGAGSHTRSHRSINLG